MSYAEHGRPGGAAERHFIERYGALARMHGLPSTIGHVFAFLLLSPVPCTAEELAEGLGVSSSTAHSSARRLERLGVLDRIVSSGERTVRFQIRSGGLTSIVQDTLRELRIGRDIAQETLRSVEGLDPVVRERLESLHHIQSSVIEAIEGAIDRVPSPPESDASKSPRTES